MYFLTPPVPAILLLESLSTFGFNSINLLFFSLNYKFLHIKLVKNAPTFICMCFGIAPIE